MANYVERAHSSLVTLINTVPGNVFVRMTGNGIAPADMPNLLRAWDVDANRRLLGSRWWQRRDRLLAVGALNGAVHAPRWDLITLAPPATPLSEFRKAKEAAWLALGDFAPPSVATVRESGEIVSFVLEQVCSRWNNDLVALLPTVGRNC